MMAPSWSYTISLIGQRSSKWNTLDTRSKNLKDEPPGQIWTGKEDVMNITRETTVKEVLEARPDALSVFSKYGVEVDVECPEAIMDFPLSDCESICHIDNVDVLIKELNEFFASAPVK